MLVCTLISCLVLDGWLTFTRLVCGTAGVIEPSFGIGRIIYCLYEHAFYSRDGDDQRTVFKFTPVAAPVKCTVFPLMQKPEFQPYTQSVADALTKAGMSRKVSSGNNSSSEPWRLLLLQGSCHFIIIF